jgi:hypothetical protein
MIGVLLVGCLAVIPGVRGTSKQARARECHASSDCPPPDDPHRVATCSRAGVCGVLDLSRGPIAACHASSDCIARPVGCCECGAHAWVAIAARRRDAYERRVCTPITTCLACVGHAPAALCRAGRCELAP